jgi:hypothetical protein
MIKRDTGGGVNRQVEVINRLRALRDDLQAIGRDLNGLV